MCVNVRRDPTIDGSVTTLGPDWRYAAKALSELHLDAPRGIGATGRGHAITGSAVPWRFAQRISENQDR